jgi:NADH-quinone oxidoreductase subunit N
MTIGFFSFFLNFYIFKFPFKYQVRYLNQLDYIITLNPLLSFTLGIILFSMAGIPPLAGFFAKFFVIFSAIKYKMFALIFLVLFCNCISCFYYIRLIKLIFFNNKIPKNFQVLPPVEKLNSYILGFVLFILILLFTDFEFVLLFTNLLSFSFI